LCWAWASAARRLPLRQLPANRRCIGDIVSLGTAGFIMQLTNSVVTICCNNVLSVTGGDMYISVMTIISSVRQMVETPIYAITEGSSPIISYNYGARRPRKVLRAAVSMALMALVYTLTIWAVILLAPHFLISIFSSDPTLQADTIPAMKLYFSTFGFMLLQYVGQTVFKSLNKRRHAVFFSLLRKVIIVVPFTYLLPYAFGMGTDGVFAAEPVSNVIGGSLCFIVMLITVLPELKRMDREDAKTAK
jgi:Na+-driven multidrug efflux pump